jgi:hypothetical protein
MNLRRVIFLVFFFIFTPPFGLDDCPPPGDPDSRPASGAG